MSSSSSPPVGDGRRLPADPVATGSGGGWRKLLFLGALCSVLLAFATLPLAPPTDTAGACEADPSLSLILTHAQEQGIQFGTEHVYTYGPFGFLFFFLYSAENGGAQMLSSLLLCLAVAAGLCLLGRRLGPCWGLLMVGSFVWVAANNQPRTDLVLNAGLLCWGLLCFIECERRLTAAVAVFAALAVFGALAKNSFLFVGALSVVLIGCDLWIRGRRRLGLGMMAGFGAGFLLGWTLAGQQWAHLPAFALKAFAVVRGYDGALGWEGMRMAEVAAWVLAGLIVILVFARCREAFPSDNRRKWRRMLLLIWIFGIAFAVWKHGVVRAFPCNIEMCFGWMAILALALNVLSGESATPRRWVAGLAFVCWLLPIGTLQWLFFPAGMQSVIRPFEALYSNAGCVLDPAGYRYRMEMTLEANRRQAQLPRLSELAGKAPVDVFGRRQAYAMFNDLNYRPRPVPQSYAACNADLMRLNEEFFLSQKRPQFVLFELQPLERKFSPLEDARALRHLLINYEPVGTEAPFVLLKSKSADPAKLTLVQEGSVQAGQQIDLRPFNSTPLWLEIEMKPSWSGMLRQLLMRPPPVRLAAQSPEGQLLTRGRAPATMLSAGFLASPLLSRTEDLLALYSQKPGVRPSGYAVELVPGHEGYWKKQIQFRIYRLENPLVQCVSPEAAHFIGSLSS
ncbi:MAG TPA: hypothetical protein VN673_03100, partial [Clostridia bacterium]|nr:hypothetical protein [Clostridia bacterium]